MADKASKIDKSIEDALLIRQRNLPPTDCDLCRKIMWKFRDNLKDLSYNAGGHLCWPGQGERGK